MEQLNLNSETATMPTKENTLPADQIRGKTKDGFEYTLNKGIEDDWELLKAIRKCNDDISYVVDVAEMVFGTEQLRRLEMWIRARDGRVTYTAVNNVIEEIFVSAGSLKNSQPSPEG